MWYETYRYVNYAGAVFQTLLNAHRHAKDEQDRVTTNEAVETMGKNSVPGIREN